MISIVSSGSFARTKRRMRALQQLDIQGVLDRAGREGVQALISATPADSGLAASSWGYRIERTKRGITIVWTNSDVERGFPVAIMLQYGYGTGTGGYVQGRDYINPAIRPIFDRISDEVRRAVRGA